MIRIDYRLAILQATLALTAASCRPAEPVVRIGYQALPNGDSYVKAKGWYEQQLGVKVELKQFDSGRDVNTALASGSIDLGQLGSTPVAVGISRGLPYEVIWIHDLIGTAEGLAVKNSANIKTFADLVGRKVAVPVSSTAHYSLLSALALKGIDAKSVKIIDLQPQEIYAAWQRGDIDGAYVWEPTLGKLLADGKLLTTSQELVEQGIVTADLEVVRYEFARHRPDVVANYLKLQIKAHAAFQANAEEVIATLAPLLDTDVAQAGKQARGLLWIGGTEQLSPKYLGTSHKKGALATTLKATADFLAAQKSIDKAGDLSMFESAVAPEYLEKAMK